jgi:hypothetical protein
MVPDLVHKFQMICPRGTKVIEGKLNDGGMGGRTWVKLNTPPMSSGRGITIRYWINFKNILENGNGF